MNREVISGSIHIAASPATVWSIVSDLRRMGEFSPQCKKMFISRGPVTKGTRTLNLNRQGWLWWPTRAKVVEFIDEKVLAFQILENTAIWRYELEPSGEGTQLRESRILPTGEVTSVSRWLTGLALGGTEAFEDELERGIQQTLEQIKKAAEAAVMP